MKLSKALSVVAAVAVLSLSVAGCSSTPSTPSNSSSAAPVSSEWQAVIDAADQEGSVVVYSGASPQINQELAKAFEKDFPSITPQIVQSSSVEIAQRFAAERAGNADSADAMLTSNGVWNTQQAAAGDQFAKITGPEVTEGIGKDEDLVFGDGQVLTIALTPIGFAWSNDVDPVPSGPDEIADNSAYKGRVGLLDYQISDVWVIWTYLLAEQYGGDDYLKKLAAQDPKWYATGVPEAQAIAAGEIDVTPLNTRGSIGTVPVPFALPPKTFANPFYDAINSEAKHPNAAQVWQNWLLSPSAQQVFYDTDRFSLNPAIKSDIALEDLTVVSLQDYTPDFIADYRAHLKSIFNH